MNETTSVIYGGSGWWLVLAIVTAGLAETKGRRRWVWFVLGLLIGPIATALVVIWAPPRNPVRTPKVGR
ncbi:hypothetical protein OSC27_06105 [Microbacterium sp. STN6]|uniref:hypothetical protein n=1 Tax=Microbacterium sp. STN6 TaxID=2995588 RepID=UPI002260BC91|nr:hypothetical protein [Microbacterium sp. STN6]MCX7521850.1 hypothetical protein [Microbacterium sp. STN6]